MEDLVIYGAGHLGKQAYHHLVSYFSEQWRILGYVDDVAQEGTEVIDGLKTLGGLASCRNHPELQPGAVKMLFAIGYADLARRRAALDRALEAEYELISLIHPRAIIEPGVKVGSGSIVLAGAILDQQVVLGAACFVDIGVRIGENSKVGANTYISAGTTIGGSVKIGESNFLGLDTTITNDVQIGNYLFINAKTLIHKSFGDHMQLVEMHKIREISRSV